MHLAVDLHDAGPGQAELGGLAVVVIGALIAVMAFLNTEAEVKAAGRAAGSAAGIAGIFPEMSRKSIYSDPIDPDPIDHQALA